MFARIRKSMEEKDEGFTLIELLVVMIIIGILAAIAIPAFLAQRDKGYQTAIKNDLKNVSIAEESYATDNNGAYAPVETVLSTTAKTDPLVSNGATLTTGVTVIATPYDVAPGTSNAYCLSGSSTKTGSKWYLDSADNVVSNTKPAKCA